jgi:hypothetical protein
LAPKRIDLSYSSVVIILFLASHNSIYAAGISLMAWAPFFRAVGKQQSSADMDNKNSLEPLCIICKINYGAHIITYHVIKGRGEEEEFSA